MKVEFPNTITIQGGAAAKALRSLPVGTLAPVRVLERFGPNDALIEVSGEKVRAAFLKGVPREDRFVLRLQESPGSSLVFKMLTAPEKKEAQGAIAPFTLFRPDEINRSVMAGIGKALGLPAMPGLFEIQVSLFFKDPARMRRHVELARLFHALSKKGIPQKTLHSLAFLLSGTQAPPDVLALLGLAGNHGMSGEEFLADIGRGIADAFQAIVAEQKSAEDIELLCRFLKDTTEKKGDVTLGHLIVHDGEFRAVPYLRRGDSWMLHLSLTNLGVIDALVRRENGGLSILLVVEKSEAADALEGERLGLLEKLQGLHKNVSINIHKKNSIIDKISEICVYYAQVNYFDRRV